MTKEWRNLNDKAHGLASVSSFEHSDFLRHSSFVLRHSFDQSDRNGITIELSLARLNRRDDHQNQIQNVENAEDHKPDQHQTEHARDQVIDQHRDLKIERLLPVLVDLSGIAALGQPNNQRTENVTGPRHKKSSQGAGVEKHIPGPDV